MILSLDPVLLSESKIDGEFAKIFMLASARRTRGSGHGCHKQRCAVHFTLRLKITATQKEEEKQRNQNFSLQTTYKIVQEF